MIIAAQRIERLYALRPDLRALHPLGLTPAGREAFVAWLLEAGPRQHGLGMGETLDYLAACRHDLSHGLAATYRFTPEQAGQRMVARLAAIRCERDGS